MNISNEKKLDANLKYPDYNEKYMLTDFREFYPSTTGATFDGAVHTCTRRYQLW